MQYQVPQYMEVKEKIVGPLTLTQFFYLAGAGAVSLIVFMAAPFIVWVLITILALGVSSALAFIQINGQSLPKIILSAIKFAVQPRLYVWRGETLVEKINLPEEKNILKNGAYIGIQEKLKNLGEKLSTSKLPIPNREKSELFFSDKKDKFVKLKKVGGETELAKKVDYK